MNESGLRRLPFESVYNFRDLGGYPAGEGMQTAYGRCYRCDGLTDLTLRDRNLLERLGVSTVIDLRMDVECQRRPSSFAAQGSPIRYVHVSPLSGLIDPGRLAASASMPVTPQKMAQLYIAMLEKNSGCFREALSTAGLPGALPMAFHCSEGKDRAGLLAMLLLGICGVSPVDIVADYQVSGTYIRHKYRTDHLWLGRETSDSDPQIMEQVLEHLEDTYGGICAYAASIGVTRETQQALRAQLLVPCILDGNLSASSRL